ncbi:MAG: hydrogen peroxide-inducible genes activator, partial [Flavobacteriales bacterium]|nr:hydrogen peroxide-inducible genes activator [Flavobacteriales bacterium]
AADRCNVTQATLSGMIKKLEKELGEVLIDRTSKPVIPTEVGWVVVNKAKQILLLQEDISGIELSTEDVLSGEIVLGVIPTVANVLLSMVFPALSEKFPDLKLVVQELTTEQLVRAMDKGELDAGILATPVKGSGWIEHVMYYESLMVYGVKASSKRYLSPQSLSSERIWLLKEGHCFRNQSLSLSSLEKSGRPLRNFRFKGNSFDTLVHLTDSWGGYTLVPELYVGLMGEERRRKARMFEKPFPVREISMVYARPQAKKKGLDALRNVIVELVKPRLATSSYKKKDLRILGIN